MYWKTRLHSCLPSLHTVWVKRCCSLAACASFLSLFEQIAPVIDVQGDRQILYLLLLWGWGVAPCEGEGVFGDHWSSLAASQLMLVNLVSVAAAWNVSWPGYLMTMIHPILCDFFSTKPALLLLEPCFDVTRLLSKQPLNLEAFANRGFT